MSAMLANDICFLISLKQEESPRQTIHLIIYHLQNTKKYFQNYHCISCWKGGNEGCVGGVEPSYVLPTMLDHPENQANKFFGSSARENVTGEIVLKVINAASTTEFVSWHAHNPITKGNIAHLRRIKAFALRHDPTVTMFQIKAEKQITMSRHATAPHR
jgi:hypothetical protein